MVQEEFIRKELAKVKHPENKRDIVSLGMIGEIKQEEGKITLLLKTPVNDRKLQIGLEAQVRQQLKGLFPGKLIIKFEVDPSLEAADENRIPGVKKVIAIGSGKGGVGKSTITVNLATQLKERGYRVGILDADIYGPSVGKMFGVQGRVPLQADEERIWPLEKNKLKIMSFSFLLNEDQPVVWRGPMLGKAIEQFLYDIVWGELDFLLVDLPPGTGDVQLSLSQLINLDGAVIVTTPQNIAILDASRAAAMFQQVKVPILGVVENMSEFICPHCGKGSQIFSSGGGDKLSQTFQSVLLGQVPLTMDLMKAGEEGIPVVEKDKQGVIAKAFQSISENLEKELKRWEA